MPLAEIENLRMTLTTREGAAKLLDGISLSIGQGELLAIVGETGSGKSLTGMSLLGITPRRSISTGRVSVGGLSVLPLGPGVLRELRGRKVAVILQNPSTALNPVFTVGQQIGEILRAHQGMRREKERRAKVVEYLREVELPRADELHDAYPHELSGGMKQLVLLAMALACRPSLIVADEATTALDVTTQFQVLRLFDRVRREHGLACVWITHDLGVAAHIASRVAVLYLGTVVEEGPVEQVLLHPRHPYTQALVAALPRRGARVRDLRSLAGDIPNVWERPSGCAFHPRCPVRLQQCATDDPPVAPVGDGHRAVCHLYTPGGEGNR